MPDYANFSTIPSLGRWKDLTGPPTTILNFLKENHNKRGNRWLQKIDNMVSTYERGFEMANPEGKRIILTAIIIACCKWLDEKEKKKNSYRRPFVLQLAKVALKELLTHDKQNAQGLVGYVNVIHIPMRRDMLHTMLKTIRSIRTIGKWEALRDAGKRLGAKPGLKMLDQDYWKETIPLINPVTGRRIHLYGAGKGEDAITSYLEEDAFSHMPYVQAAQLLVQLSTIRPDVLYGESPTQPNNIWYFDGEDRLHHRLFCKDDIMYKLDDNGQLYVTPQTQGAIRSPAGAGDLYAAAENGIIYSAPRGEGNNQVGQVRHSSFLAGKAVLCAGFIRFDNQGKVVWLDNDSGHYRPSRQNLLSLLEKLRTRLSDGAFKNIMVLDHATRDPNVDNDISGWVYAHHFVTLRGVLPSNRSELAQYKKQ